MVKTDRRARARMRMSRGNREFPSFIYSNHIFFGCNGILTILPIFSSTSRVHERRNDARPTLHQSAIPPQVVHTRHTTLPATRMRMSQGQMVSDPNSTTSLLARQIHMLGFQYANKASSRHLHPQNFPTGSRLYLIDLLGSARPEARTTTI